MFAYKLLQVLSKHCGSVELISNIDIRVISALAGRGLFDKLPNLKNV